LTKNNLQDTDLCGIGNCQNLKWLYLGQNQLKCIPKELGSLKNLEVLYLNDNAINLKGIGTDFGETKKLKDLRLHGNKKLKIPNSLRNANAQSVMKKLLAYKKCQDSVVALLVIRKFYANLTNIRDLAFIPKEIFLDIAKNVYASSEDTCWE
jgi:Leucine-rich repeat (LRR) protein